MSNQKLLVKVNALESLADQMKEVAVKIRMELGATETGNKRGLTQVQLNNLTVKRRNRLK